MYRFFVFLLGIMMLFGCSERADVSPINKCSYEQKIPAVTTASESGSIFLFGEKHGTSEAPTFVADFACRIAVDTGEPTIVLLELAIPKILSDLSTSGISISQAQTLILEGDSHWSDSRSDGRTSVAMMSAILHILKMREQGLDIALGSIYPDEKTHTKYDDLNLTFADKNTYINRYFQEAIQILKYKDDFKNVIVLSGKNHTRNHLRFFGKMNLDENYLGFVQQTGGGTEWNCQPGAGGCGVHIAQSYRRDMVDVSDNASLVMLDENGLLFDGAFVFKTTSASPPFIKPRSP